MKVKDPMENIIMPFWKRALAVGLSGALAVTLCPASALADEVAPEPETEAVEQVPVSEEAADSAVAAPADEPMAVADPAPADEATPPPATETPGTDAGGTGDAGNAGNTGDGATQQPPANKPADEPAKPQPQPAKPKKAVISFKTASKLAGSKWQKKTVSSKTQLSKVMGKTMTTKPLVAMRIYNKSKNIKGSIKYRVYMANKGWSKWVVDGKTAGNGKSKNAVQGMQVKLTGDLGKQYNVYYRAYLTGLGWTGWGKNGAKVGAPKLSKVKAYQVKLVKKTNKKTNKKYNTKKNKNSALVTTKSGTEMNTQMTMAAKAQGQKSATKWLILVDTHKNRVEILKGQKGDWKVYKYWKCTSGAAGSRTVRGKFTIGSRGRSFGEEKGYSCWYWTQFHGNYLFHSVLYNVGSQSSIQDGRLGINASHGCVRLALKNAKWINRNIPSGTKVWTY